MLDVLIIFAVAVLMLGLALRLFEARLVYHPRPLAKDVFGDLVGQLEERGETWREAEFPAADGVRLTGWYGEPAEPRAWLLWLHGNAGNVSHRWDDFQSFVRQAGLAVLLLDYRGYGRSAGRPSEAGLYLDARAAWDELLALGADPEKIFLHGRSLGGAVAVELAGARPARGVILQSTFTSFLDLARETVPILPLGWFAKSRYPTLTRLPELEQPVLLFHGTADRMVPIAHGRRLAEQSGRVELVEVTGAGHEDLSDRMGPVYFARVVEFVDRCLALDRGAVSGDP